MLRQIFLILIIVFICCKDRVHKKTANEPVQPINTSPTDSKTNNNGIVKWIRDDRTKEELPASINKFISRGRKPLYSAFGDINSDGQKDILLITTIQNEDDLLLDTVTLKRELLLLLGKDGNDFRLIRKSENAVPSINCCGGMIPDAFAGIKASYGEFTLLYYSGSNWKDTRASTFKFDKAKQDWFLDHEITESFFMDWQNYEVDTLTKKDFGIVPISKFNIYEIYGAK